MNYSEGDVTNWPRLTKFLKLRKSELYNMSLRGMFALGIEADTGLERKVPMSIGMDSVDV